MPPANSPNPTDDPTHNNPLTSSTRMPIIRAGDDVESQITSWRELLARVVEQTPDTSQEVSGDIDIQHRRTTNRRFTNTRRERTQPSTYRGWAPGTTELDHPTRIPLQGPLSHFELHTHSPSRSTATRRYLRELERHQPARENIANAISSVIDGTDAAQHRRLRDAAVTRSPPSNSLRTVALLEAARRQHRLESLRERIRNFTDARAQEHEQYLEQIEILDEYTRLSSDYGTSNQEVSPANEHLQAALDEHRSTKLLQEGIKNMDDIKGRTVTSPIKPPPSSWLRPGASFSGQQQANNIRSRQNLRRQQEDRSPDEAGDLPMMDIRTDQIAPSNTSEQSGDWWPVKVKITSVDYKTMALTGTMEAFNVSKTKGVVTGQDPTVSNITTYLEGEIIDFYKHTLRTTNFKAGSVIDSTYWRKLEPFKNLTNTEIVDGLRDAEWIREHITQHWILMRWKEKCFITSTESSSVLTISGFYYISMRRSDGKIEGFYHDPSACPYQRLNLTPEKPMFPVYTFT